MELQTSLIDYTLSGIDYIFCNRSQFRSSMALSVVNYAFGN